MTAPVPRMHGNTHAPGGPDPIPGLVITPDGGSPPTGAAGGVLSGTYPNPGFAVDMATQTELDTAVGLKVDKDSVVAAASRIVASKLAAGDTQPAFRILGDGKTQWGPGGGTAPDTSLYRYAGGILWTTGSLVSDATFASKITAGVAFIADNYAAAEAAMLQSKHAAEANLRFQITSYGKLQWGPGTTGLDTVLYRGGGAQVATDGDLVVGNTLSAIQSFVTGDAGYAGGTRFNLFINGQGTKQVRVGAADSGGAGFRALVVGN